MTIVAVQLWLCFGRTAGFARYCWLQNVLRLILLHLLGLYVSNYAPRKLSAQSNELPAGFSRISDGQRLTIITDLPLDDSVQELPQAFEQAMPLWCQQFSVQPQETESWQLTLYLMLNRERFKQAGFIPAEVPEFPYGWQYNDQIWVLEQPSQYYRRHLILHEGTHWFMYRKYGFYNAPWLTEGLAELWGTHRWVDSKLTMGIVPANRIEVPYWGRTKLIRDQAANRNAPSLEEILRYDSSAHQRVDAYAWSWALVLFLQHHPDTAKVFQALLKHSAMDSSEVERWLRSRLAVRLPQLRSSWRAFITELDYGFSVEPGMLKLSDRTTPLAQAAEFTVAADRSWQATGISVAAGQTLQIDASGQFSVAQQPRPWLCTPAGVTLEYYRGQPLGMLMMTVLAPQAKEQPTELIELIPVGEKLMWVAREDGEIFFRVNESTAKLTDNSGQLSVRIVRE